MNKAYYWHKYNFQNQKGICPKGCVFTNVLLGPAIIVPLPKSNGTYSEVVFYLNGNVKTTSEFLLYSGLSMVAEVGSYLGLLLGISLLDTSIIFSRLIYYSNHIYKK
jgi:hypothetical protein